MRLRCCWQGKGYFRFLRVETVASDRTCLPFELVRAPGLMPARFKTALRDASLRIFLAIFTSYYRHHYN